MPYLLRQGNLQVFEDPETYFKNDKPGYWGEVTSTIDWCERNYEISHYIAEFNNTWSNIGFVILGLYGLLNAWNQKMEARTMIVYAGVIVVGLGSAGFHGTLLHFWQQGDETPMILTAVVYCYNLMFLDPQYEQKHPTLEKVFRYGGIAFCAVWTVVHNYMRFVIIFQLFFGAIAASCGALIFPIVYHCKDKAATSVGLVYLVSMFAATACWLADSHLCDALHQSGRNPQFHAWWHILSGLSTFSGANFLSYMRAYNLGQHPKFARGWIPFVPLLKISHRQE